jgi:hypothetical protein
MRSPFDELGMPKLQERTGEEITGAFSCQEDGCWDVQTTARYISEIKTVTWQCKFGHISKVTMDLD